MKGFLLEIGTEEIPARFLSPALRQLEELAKTQLQEKRIDFKSIKAVGTPRRMAVYVSGLEEKQAPLVTEVKGPARKAAFDAGGKPTQAALGFARSQGVDMADLIIKKVGQVEYVFARKSDQGKPTIEILAEICPVIISGLHFPKPMRWGDLDYRFARPIKWIVALYGDQVINFEIANIQTGSISYGHRFLCKDPVRLENPEEYMEKMRKAYVMVDPEERSKSIWTQVENAAKAAGGRVKQDDELLAEVNNLVEYPTVFTGNFDPDYLRIPKEVLVTVMREHQKYFPVYSPDGKLLPQFIGVRNGTEEHIDIVRAGNERVLKARLADAAFFWDEDLKLPLAERVPELKKIVWQESLGTVYDKVERITRLAEFTWQKLNFDKSMLPLLNRAAFICKADLVTNMVCEFTELQGVMGREYALKSGEDPVVAQAVFEHYLPRFADDILPETQVGRILSLADKFDTLVGCFAVGIQPTGSQDPYGLRRLALGAANIILDGKLILSLKELVAKAYEGYGLNANLKVDRDKVIVELDEFFKQRVRGLLLDWGFAYDIVDAGLAVGIDDLLGAVQRIEALKKFRTEQAFDAVITAFNRANNLAKKYDGTAVLPQLFEHQSEEELYRSIQEVRKDVEVLLSNRDYDGALHRSADLRGPVDNFFDAVMVMVEDEALRNNRLALLNNVALLISPLADLSKIVIS